MISSVGGTFWAVSSIGGTFWAISSVGGTILAVSSVAGTWLAEAEKTKVWGHFFGRNAIRRYVLAVRSFSFFGGNTLAVGGITKIWR